MQVVLLGFGALALGLLEGLLETPDCHVVGVYPWSSSEKSSHYKDKDEKQFLKLIDTYGINKIECLSVNHYGFVEEIKRLNPDIILVGSWGEKFKPHLFNIPECQIINCHPSLLPKHRGASPYVSAIREGESESGITFHVMTEDIDQGPVLLQKSVGILPTDTGQSLKAKCGLLARVLVQELMNGLNSGTLKPKPQNEALATSYPAVKAEDGLINWHEEPERLERTIRALIPWAQSHGYINGKRLIRFEPLALQKINHNQKAGTVLAVHKNGVIQIASSDTEMVFSAYRYQIHNGIVFLPSMLSRHWAKMFVKAGSIFQ